ncbi:MAG: replication protein [Candidatus Anammoxibacter sp.]
MASPQIENGFFQISTEYWKALRKIRIPGEAKQILECIIEKTWMFHKKEDWISLSQFSEMTSINIPCICRAIKKLQLMNLIITNITIIQKDSRPLSKKITQVTKYSIQKDYDSWQPLSKKITIIQKDKRRTIQKDNLPLSKKIDTKDTITKNSKTKEIKKVKFLDFIYLSEDEHRKLVEKFGEDGTAKYIEKINSYAHQIGSKKFKTKYDSHYHTILNWNRSDEEKTETKTMAFDAEHAKALEATRKLIEERTK